MKYVLLLYCVCAWYFRVSCSFRLAINKTMIADQEDAHSKYAYSVISKNSTASTTTKTNNSLASDVVPTISPTDNCNVASEGDATSQTMKRFIHHFYSQLTTTPDAIDLSLYNEEFLTCAHISVEPGCFQKLPNGSVYVPLYKRLFDRSNHFINNGTLYVCPDFFDSVVEPMFSRTMEIISSVGMAISTVCILLHMIMFCLTDKLRNLPGYCLFCFCVSLLFMYLVFVIQTGIHDEADCKVIGLFKMYSLLASFSWMNVISFDVWYAIRLATCKLRLNTNRSMLVRFSIYSSYAWGLPFLLIIIAMIVDKTTDTEQYRLIFETSLCWFQYRSALLFYFAIPVFILLLLNAVFFVSSFVMISRTRSKSGSDESHDLRSQLFMSLRLGSVMGFMWIFGVITAVNPIEWIFYLHSFCTALQGVFIFFSFTINEKTKLACKKVFGNKKISVVSTKSHVPD